MLVYNLNFFEDICAITDPIYLHFFVLDLSCSFDYNKLLNFLNVDNFSETFFDFFYFHGNKPMALFKDSYIKDFDYFFTNSEDIVNLNVLKYNVEYIKATTETIINKKTKKEKTIVVFKTITEPVFFNYLLGFNNLDFDNSLFAHALTPLNNALVRTLGNYRTNELYVMQQHVSLYLLIYQYLLWVLVILSLSSLFSGFNKLFFESRSFFYADAAWSFVRKNESEQSLLFFNTLLHRTLI